MAKIIITGSTGYVGVNLIRRLIKENKSVFAIVRPGEQVDFFLNNKVPYAFADVTDEGFLDPFVEEGDQVVHLAAAISISKRDEGEVYRVNYEGTKNALASSLKKKAKSFVYLSSVHAIPFHEGGIVEEDFFALAKKSLGEYETSKRKATELVFDYRKKGLETSVIFPSGILGPGDALEGEMTTLIRKIAAGRLPFYVSGGYAFCDVRDVAEVIVRVLERGGDSYLVSGGYLSIRDIFRIVQEETGISSKTILVPRILAYVCLPLVSLFQKHAKKKPLFTAYSLHVTSQKPVFVTEKATRELGVSFLSPEISLRDEIAFIFNK